MPLLILNFVIEKLPEFTGEDVVVEGKIELKWKSKARKLEGGICFQNERGGAGQLLHKFFIFFKMFTSSA